MEYIFKKQNNIVEEIDFPEKREDMRVGQEFPDLKTILIKIINKENFSSKYINENENRTFRTSLYILGYEIVNRFFNIQSIRAGPNHFRSIQNIFCTS